LVQKSQDFFIALRTDEAGAPLLCAFPKLGRSGEGSAWVTKEKELVFAVKLNSCEGRFYFSKGEELPLIETAADGYRVQAERFARTFDAFIPSTAAAFQVVTRTIPDPVVETVILAPPVEIAAPAPEPVLNSLPTERRAKESRPVIRPRRIESADSRTPSPAIGPMVNITFLPSSTEEPEEVVAEPEPQRVTEKIAPVVETVTALDPVPETRPEPVASAAEAVAAPALPEVPAETASAPETVVAGVVPAASSPVAVATEEEPDHGFLQRNFLAVRILCAFVVIEGLLILKLNRDRKRKAAPEASTYEAISSFDDSLSLSIVQDPEREGVFSGSLNGIGIAELVQFLNGAHESGIFTIKGTDDRIHQLYFRNGEIIDASSQDRTGVDAIRMIFRQKDGSFSFSRDDPLNRERAVRQSTMSLLLEVSQFLDEERGKAEETAAAAPRKLTLRNN